MNPRPTPDELMAYYSSFGHGSGDAPTTEVDTENMVKEIREHDRKNPDASPDPKIILDTMTELGWSPGRLLDVGCGYGRFFGGSDEPRLYRGST